MKINFKTLHDDHDIEHSHESTKIEAEPLVGEVLSSSDDDMSKDISSDDSVEVIIKKR